MLAVTIAIGIAAASLAVAAAVIAHIAPPSSRSCTDLSAASIQILAFHPNNSIPKRSLHSKLQVLRKAAKTKPSTFTGIPLEMRLGPHHAPLCVGARTQGGHFVRSNAPSCAQSKAAAQHRLSCLRAFGHHDLGHRNVPRNKSFCERAHTDRTLLHEVARDPCAFWSKGQAIGFAGHDAISDEAHQLASPRARPSRGLERSGRTRS